MCEFKTQPLQQLMRMIHPDLYRLDDMSDKVSPQQVALVALHPNAGREGCIYCTSTCRLQGALHLNDSVVPQPHLLHLSAERLSRDGAFLMDCGYVSSHQHVFDSELPAPTQTGTIYPPAGVLPVDRQVLQ